MSSASTSFSSARSGRQPAGGEGVRPYRWTVEQYEAMGAAGVFEPGTRVELLDGEIWEQETRGQRHSRPPEGRPPVWRYCWSVDEYERLVDAGIFPPGTRAELIDGEVYEMSPQGSKHATTLSLMHQALQARFGEGHVIRVQSPMRIPGSGEPEPDVAVVLGAPRDFLEAHPSSAVLVVEVSDTTLRFDRTAKLALYARAGIPEYWIVNLIDRVIEVYRDPAGDTYSSKTTLKAGDHVSPASRPDSDIPVADLLP
jgi:Uma2 family endonuclease